MRSFVLLCILLSPGLGAAQERGAKELFFDPLDRQVMSAQPQPAESPPPSEQRVRETSMPADSTPRTAPGTPRAAPGPKREGILGLSYWIELVGPAGNAGAQVTERRVFRSGDRIRLHFRSNADGHIALIQLGSSGTSQFLFPDPAQGLLDSRLAANEERILPSPAHWFRFDDHPGTEKLLVLFARSQEELDDFQARPLMDEDETKSLMRRASYVQGSKDLVIETEERVASEIGTYGVNVSGQPVVLEIRLEHR